MHFTRLEYYFKTGILGVILFSFFSCTKEEINTFDPRISINTGMDPLLAGQVMSDGNTIVVGILNGVMASTAYDVDGNKIAAISLSEDNQNPTIIPLQNATYSVYNLYPGIVEERRGVYTSANERYFNSFELDVNPRGTFMSCERFGANTAYLIGPNTDFSYRYLLILDEIGEIVASRQGINETFTSTGNMIVHSDAIYYNYGIWDEGEPRYALRKVDQELISIWGFFYPFSYDFRLNKLSDGNILVYNPDPMPVDSAEYVIISEDGREYTEVTDSDRLPDSYQYVAEDKYVYADSTKLMFSDSYLNPDIEILEDFESNIVFVEAINDGSVLVGLENGTVTRLFP